MSNPTVTNVDGSNTGPTVVTSPSPYLYQGGPAQIGVAATSLVAFYGATPVAQRTSAAQTTITTTTGVSGGVGCATTAGLSALIAAVQEIQATLTGLGLWKGS